MASASGQAGPRLSGSSRDLVAHQLVDPSCDLMAT